MQRAHRRWGRSNRQASSSTNRRVAAGPSTTRFSTIRDSGISSITTAIFRRLSTRAARSGRTSWPSMTTAPSGKSSRHCAVSGSWRRTANPDRSLQREERRRSRGFIPGRGESARGLEDHVQRRELLGAIQRSGLRQRRPEIDRVRAKSAGKGALEIRLDRPGRTVARPCESRQGSDWKVAQRSREEDSLRRPRSFRYPGRSRTRRGRLGQLPISLRSLSVEWRAPCRALGPSMFSGFVPRAASATIA